MSEGQTIRDLRGERLALLVRYDGHLSPAIYGRIRQIEIQIAWAQHRQAAPTPGPERVRLLGEQLRGTG